MAFVNRLSQENFDTTFIDNIKKYQKIIFFFFLKRIIRKEKKRKKKTKQNPKHKFRNKKSANHKLNPQNQNFTKIITFDPSDDDNY